MKSVILLSLAACAVAAPTAGVETIHDGAAPILSSSNAEAIPNAYIIKFKKHVDHKSAADHQMWIQKVHGEREDERLELRKRGLFDSVNDAFTGLKHTYNVGSGFLGYAGHFDEETIEKVRRHPDVSIIFIDCHWVANKEIRLVFSPGRYLTISSLNRSRPLSATPSFTP